MALHHITSHHSAVQYIALHRITLLHTHVYYIYILSYIYTYTAYNATYMCIYICDWLKLVTPKTEGFANSGWTIESKVNHHDIAVLFKTWLRWPGSKSSNIAAHIDLFQKSAHFGSGVPTWLWHREPSSNCTDEPGESPIDGGTYQKIRVSHGECDQQNGDTTKHEPLTKKNVDLANK